jgi:uncharacterized protein (DUF58 family)
MLPVRTVQRGFVRPGLLRISTRFPLGLFRAWSYLESDQNYIVYPRPAGVRDLPEHTAYAMEGRQGTMTGTDDFTGFKPYRHGDSIRNIDWKAYAKAQPLQVKRFSGSGSGKLILRWDHCRPDAGIEQRLSQLCLWVLRAEQEDFQYGLELPGIAVEPGHGEAHRDRCLTRLAGYGITSAAA